MGNRTSDFIALAAILGGAGLGLGLTSLVAGTATVARADDASVEVHVVPSRVLVRDGSGAPAIYFRSRTRCRDAAGRLRKGLGSMRRHRGASDVIMWTGSAAMSSWKSSGVFNRR